MPLDGGWGGESIDWYNILSPPPSLSLILVVKHWNQSPVKDVGQFLLHGGVFPCHSISQNQQELGRLGEQKTNSWTDRLDENVSRNMSCYYNAVEKICSLAYERDSVNTYLIRQTNRNAGLGIALH